MSVKALRNQLLAAIAMVLVAALALSSSTFAWFAANTSVTANDMKVKVKSNDTFLLIETDSGNPLTPPSVTSMQANPKKTVDVITIGTDEAEVYPAKPLETDEIGQGKLFPTGTAALTAATASTAASWYTANSDTHDKATTNVINQHVLATLNDYVVTRHVYLTLAKNSDTAHSLSVKPTFTADAGKTIDAVKVLVVVTPAGGTPQMKILSTAQNRNDVAFDTDFTLTDSLLVNVDLYIYYDGSVSSVTTANKTNLGGADVDLEFKVVTGSAT